MPRRLVTFDSEAHRSLAGTVETHDFRLAVAALDVLDVDGHPERPTDWLEAFSPGELWRGVDAFTSTRHRTVVFAHHLPYDLRLTAALEELPALGWELRGLAMTSHSCWVRLRRGDRSLVLCDSTTWLPVTLDRVAAELRRRRPRLPRDRDPEERWLARCRADVRVLREALLNLLQWLREDDLGDFRLTGAAQSSAAFRHRFLEAKTLLIHDDAEALAAERRAAWCGRSEVWRHGRVQGPIEEWDLTAAYARIARDCQLPVRLVGETNPRDLAELRRIGARYAVLADVELRSEAPTVPASHEGRILWPVGTFSSTLWDVELELAARQGATIEVGRCWVYQRGPLMRRWAEWILAGLEGEPPGDDPLRRIVLKEWSRALVGRFGLRYPQLEDWGVGPTSDVAIFPVRDAIDGVDRTFLQVGRQLYEQTERVESRDSCPQLMGWIMARCRVALWELIAAAGADHVLAIDTDGLLVDSTGGGRLEALARRRGWDGLRLKGKYTRAELRGPRNLDLEDQRRVSGVPRSASRLAPGLYRGEVWESLPGALRRRRSSQVVVSERTISRDDHDPRRLHLAEGRTAPVCLPTMPQGAAAVAAAGLPAS